MNTFCFIFKKYESHLQYKTYKLVCNKRDIYSCTPKYRRKRDSRRESKNKKGFAYKKRKERQVLILSIWIIKLIMQMLYNSLDY
jgi:hypothetical protein